MNVSKLHRKPTAYGLIALALCIFLGALVPAQAQSGLQKFSKFNEASDVTIDHSAWDRFLSTYVSTTSDNRTIVNYAGVTEADRSSLQNYLESLQAVQVDGLNRAESYAYWVNLYNAVTVEVILDNYPLKSIRRLGFGLGPWNRKLATVQGEKLSLNNIEHDILRVFWSDPRTHYAVNCASFGCPNLATTAFTAENTEQLLDQGARDYINHPRGTSVDDRGRVTASSIYKWYQVDFGDSEEGVLSHMRQYADDDLKSALEGKTDIRKFDYDWALNEK